MIFHRTIGLRDLVASRSDGNGEPIIHLPGAGTEYDTLCGLDLGGDAEEQAAPLPRGARVTCSACVGIWYLAKTVPGSWVDAKALASMPLGAQS